MKQYFLPFILSFIAITISAQDVIYDFDSKIEVKKKEKLVESPYSMFGDNTAVLQTKHEDEKDHSLKIPILEDGRQDDLFKLDFQTGVVSITDKEGNLLSQVQLDEENSARFTTIDPMAEKYYSISPYVYCANNPLKYTDPNGDTIRVSIYNSQTKAMDNYYYGTDANGKRGFIGANGNLYTGTDTFVSSLTTALGKLDEKSVGRGLVDALASSTNTVTIINGKSNGAADDGSFIRWNNSNQDPSMPTRQGFIGLAHEMAHIQDTWNGTRNDNPWVNVADMNGNNVTIREAEKYATHMENRIRGEHNMQLRTHYAYQQGGGGYEPTRIIDATTSRSLFYTQKGLTSTMQFTRNAPIMTIKTIQIPFIYH